MLDQPSSIDSRVVRHKRQTGSCTPLYNHERSVRLQCALSSTNVRSSLAHVAVEGKLTCGTCLENSKRKVMRGVAE